MRTMDFVTRAGKFIVRNTLRDPLYLLRYAVAYIQTTYVTPVEFLSIGELTSLIHRGKSLIRMGDGEIYIMNHGSVHYQPYNSLLRQKLLKIIKEYRDSSPYVLGIPKTYIEMTNVELRKKHMLRMWLPFKIMYRYFFPRGMTYFDAHTFYEQGFETHLKSLIEESHTIIVTNKETISKLKQRGLEGKITSTFIETPSQDAFKEYEAIFEKTIHTLQLHPNAKILVSMGPAAKVLVYDLSKKGYAAYDIGRGLEVIYSDESLAHLI